MIEESLEWTGERLTTIKESEIMIEHLHRYALAISLAKAQKVLDIASGEGYGAYLLSHIAANVTGVDISQDTIAFAKSKYKAKNLQFLHGSATNMPIETQSIDLVVSFETIEHLVEQEEMFIEIKRVLKPNGILIMSSPDKLNYSEKTSYSNPFHLKELYLDEFIQLVNSKFQHSQYLSQAVCYGSLITPYNQEVKGFKEFSGHFRKINESNNMVAPIYNLCIASDFPLSEKTLASQSFFNAHDLLQRLRSKEAEIYNSKTYKAGLLLTLPLRLLRSLFSKK